MMTFIRILVGGALLALGRKLFWFFVGGIGFFLAFDLATRLFRGMPLWLTLLLALGVGIIGALLAVFFQSAAIWLAGFFAGGYLVMSLLSLIGLDAGLLGWIGFFIGGIAGGVLVALFFDWALIVLSSLSGASLIVQAFNLPRVFGLLVYAGLFVLGVIVQAVILRSEKHV